MDELAVALMRKDPPVDMEYVHATQLLELAERRGCLVVNRPSALRDLRPRTPGWQVSVCRIDYEKRIHGRVKRA